MSVKLNPGDLLLWVEDEPERSAALLVGEDGVSLHFQFGRKPWHESGGLTAREAEAVLNSPSRLALRDFGLPGRLYKSYDEATGRSFADPNLEL